MLMNAKEQRALKSFVQTVNPKAEPMIINSWVKKINTKNREDTRFAVATNSALYLCKSMSFTKNIRISNIFAWVDLTSFKIINDTTIQFIFKNASTKLVIRDSLVFAKSIFSVLQRIVPSIYENIAMECPEIKANEASTPHRTQFLDLFISYSHSMGVTYNPQFCLRLRKSLRMGEPLSLLHGGAFDQITLEIAMKALELTKTISFLKVGGFSFHNLFPMVGHAVTINKTLRKIKIENYVISSKFQTFFTGLKESSVKHLTFESVTFKPAHIDIIITNIRNCLLKSLSFIGCDFNNSIFSPILDSGKNFSSLHSFEVSGDEEKSCFLNYNKLLLFLQDSQMKDVKLTKMGIDIGNFLDQIKNFKNLQLESLDLSYNTFKKKKIDNYIIPPSLKSFKISNVTWGKNTLKEFLIKLSYISSNLHIDFSSAIIEKCKHQDIFSDLSDCVITPTIVSLNWNNNIITPKLFQYFSEYLYLEKASFDYCKILKDEDIQELLNALIHFISKTHVEKLSVKGTFGKLKSNFILLMKDALIKSYITKLNISDNKIGENGLTILKDIIMQSHIGIVTFDGSEITNPSSLIQFFREISECNHLFYVSKPRRDISFIGANCTDRIHRKLSKAWRKLKSKVHHNKKSLQNYQLSDNESVFGVDSSLFSSDCSSVNFYSSIISMPTTNVEASWDIDLNIDLGFIKHKWDDLKEEYSVLKLAGVEHFFPTNPSFSPRH